MTSEESLSLRCRAHDFHNSGPVSAVTGTPNVRNLAALSARAEDGNLVVVRASQVEIVETARCRKRVLSSHVRPSKR
jgi:hypothetical protein